MSTSSGNPDEWTGRDAVSWFRGFDNQAPQLMDRAVIATQSVFGHDVSIAAIAPIEPASDAPTDLFLTISGDIDDDRAWKRLVDLHRRFFIDAQPVPAPPGGSFERVHFVLADEPTARPMSDAVADWFRR